MASLDMSPAFTIYDSFNRAGGYTELLCRGIAGLPRFVKCPYFPNNLFIENSLPLPRSQAASSFLKTILVIVVRRSMEKMTRIAARAVIAFVKYVQALWNRTKCESVCDTVGCGVLPVPLVFSVTCFAIYGSDPLPALRWRFLFNPRPKASFKGRLFGPSCKGTFRAPFHPLFVSFDFGMLPP
jgi:hypothetical protein